MNKASNISKLSKVSRNLNKLSKLGKVSRCSSKLTELRIYQELYETIVVNGIISKLG